MDRQQRRKKGFRYVFSMAAITASAFLQVFVIQAFIRPANLLSSGFTGIAILMDQIAGLQGKSIPVSLGMIMLNLPVALICSRSISIRFTVFSMMQVFLTGLFLHLFQFGRVFDDVILNVIFGGALYGASIAIAVRGNASTGGTDFIALYVSGKTGKSIWEYIFLGNVGILCIFGYLFGWAYAGYSILFQFISTKVIHVFYNRYDQVTLQITTEHAKEVIGAYVAQYRHGISCMDAVGGYSRKKMYVLHTVISFYEVQDIIRLLKSQDPDIVINLMKTEQFYGGFYRAPIDQIH